jgi:riboflavin synthase alpha subunit
VIPETYRRTTLSRKRPGDRANVEIDLVARYRKAPPARRK